MAMSPAEHRAHSRGLYDPQFEHASCGVGFIAHLRGQASHAIVAQGLSALAQLHHRGGRGADPDTGDGAGILLQMPDALLRPTLAAQGVTLPPRGAYAAGMIFLPHAVACREHIVAACHVAARAHNLRVLAWRDVPTHMTAIGRAAARAAPVVKHVFLAAATSCPDAAAFEKRLYAMRRHWEKAVDAAAWPGSKDFYVVSLSARVLTYKGMLHGAQLGQFYSDLLDPRCASALALVHQRFSTNTFPSWSLAHPYRYVAHNGEINTLRGNINWMRARQAVCGAADADVSALLPVVREGGSDTATFDNVLEFLVAHGRSLPHAMLMMIPEPWSQHDDMSAARRAFYAYHASFMEPWDGPAAMCFTDGVGIGALLDRNGLRPSRYVVTRDERVIMASEIGVVDVPPADILVSERLHPGRMLWVDTAAGNIVDDDALKDSLAAAHPYAAWLREQQICLDDLPAVPALILSPARRRRLLGVMGYTQEDQRYMLDVPAQTGEEPLGSMGSDTPLAILSSRPRLLFDYFKQLFAQVTNPPLDALREALVTQMASTLGPEDNLLAPTPQAARQIRIATPVLSNDQLAKLSALAMPGLRARVLSSCFRIDAADPGAALARGVTELQAASVAALHEGATLLILSDRQVDRRHAPIPSLLATAAVHQHLVRQGLRTRMSLIVETGEAREVHHMALLLGYGAGAVNPYLACAEVAGRHSASDAVSRYLNALTKGLLKVMSKMGISALASYRGAQVFEAVGIAQDCIDAYFTGTHSSLDGIGLAVIAEEVLARHRRAFTPQRRPSAELPSGGEYQWRQDGEYHLFNPYTVQTLQHATRRGQYSLFKQYSQAVNEQTAYLGMLRSLLALKPAAKPLAITDVEPVEAIIQRFATGAMSFGSISAEAHETLAIAANRLGARSNSGEGGEDPARYHRDASGDWRRSAIKQVASGRFGVTSEYLINASDLQIKMAQGAKPGEGGQLPGDKVYPWIARVRHATPGVGLISPPPHHDVYSIEDLAQLIFDLRSANDAARIHVKLVAEAGVGTVAAGVAKADADVVLISGYDGGTGAAPFSSIKHAGVPWELGLAETQQVLRRNGLRERIVVQVDGHMKTGRDVLIAALLGAEEFGFATAPLVVSGCIMMRVCHLNTCPVGIATQDPLLRQRFSGRPEFIENFFRFVAEEVREGMASLGFRTLAEMIGRADCLTPVATEHWKARHLNLAALLHVPASSDRHAGPAQARRHSVRQHDLDATLIQASAAALKHGENIVLEHIIRNIHRSVGTRLGAELTRRYGGRGLPDHTLRLRFDGIAGQSFGAFVPRGMTLSLRGAANDGVGKGLCGGVIAVMSAPECRLADAQSVVVGNVALYGATSGRFFCRGVAGERFAVRNSGADAVVEGVGDHGCEYMTGGHVVVLGAVGRNFAAGMSGGLAYVLDSEEQLPTRLNPASVLRESLDEDDTQRVQSLLRQHVALTESPHAAAILAQWSAYQRHFVKVIPKEYKAVQAALQTEHQVHSRVEMAHG